MKRILLIVLLGCFSSALFAQQRMRPDGMGGWVIEDTGGCGGLFGAAQGACLANQQNMQQQQMWQQQMLQQEQIRQQQIIQQQQIENQRLQNEILRKKLEQENQSNQSAQPTPQASQPSTPEFLSWKSENAWFETDRPRTEFAMLYAKQLRQERPDLIGRPFFDAVTRKVRETFGDAR